MSTLIEVELDDQGRLIVPIHLAQRLGLAHGATLVIERETADATYLRIQKTSPLIVEEDGVLVITAVADQSIDNTLHQEREQHLDALWERNDARPD